MSPKKEFENWPLYFAPLILLGNPKSNVGILTLWTEKEKIQSALKENSYLAVGQLYSKNGINPLLRNILANPIIRHLVLCGKELSGSGQNLINFFQNGIDEEYNIIGSIDARIDREISLEALNLLRENVKVVDLRDVFDTEKIEEEIAKLESGLPPFTKPQVFPETELASDVFPSEVTGMNVRGSTVKECWIKILALITYYGYVKKSQHGDDQKELIALTTVITDEDPENIEWFDKFTVTRDDLEKYYPQVLTANAVEGVHYTYGQRLRDHDGIDQVAAMIEDLKKALYSRRAVACTWKVPEDYNSSNCPCLDLVQALVQGNKLYATFYLRSNDMFRAWPENSFAFRKLQKYIADEVGCELGDTVIISNSAHIYSSNWNEAKEIVEKYGRKYKCAFDPRGNFIILIDKDKKEIVAQHQSPTGLPLREYRAATAMQMFEILATHNAVSDFLHAMDIGGELVKAETALLNNLNYTQDRKLQI